MEMMLDKTQTQVIFLFKLQLSHKAEEITCSINTAFGLGTTNEHTVQWWFKTLKMRSTVANHQKLSTTNWEDHRSWSSYNHIRSCPRTQRQPSYSRLAFEANWKGEKARKVGATWAGCKKKKKKKKIVILKRHHFLVYLMMNHLEQ